MIRTRDFEDPSQRDEMRIRLERSQEEWLSNPRVSAYCVLRPSLYLVELLSDASVADVPVVEALQPVKAIESVG